MHTAKDAAHREVAVAALCGIAFLMLVTVPTVVIGSSPAPDDAVEKYLAYYRDHRSAIVAGDLLGVIGVTVGLVYFARLIAVVREGRRASSTVATSALLAIGAVATMMGLGFAISATAAFRAGSAAHASAETVTLLHDGLNIVFTLLGLPLAAFLGVFGLVALGGRVLPAWLGALALLAAAAEVAAAFEVLGTTGAYSPEGTLSYVLGLVPLGAFVLASSALMLSRPQAFGEARRAPTRPHEPRDVLGSAVAG